MPVLISTINKYTTTTTTTTNHVVWLNVSFSCPYMPFIALCVRSGQDSSWCRVRSKPRFYCISIFTSSTCRLYRWNWSISKRWLSMVSAWLLHCAVVPVQSWQGNMYRRRPVPSELPAWLCVDVHLGPMLSRMSPYWWGYGYSSTQTLYLVLY